MSPMQAAEANASELRTVNTSLQQQLDKLQQCHAAASEQVQQLEQEREAVQSELDKVSLGEVMGQAIGGSSPACWFQVALTALLTLTPVVSDAFLRGAAT